MKEVDIIYNISLVVFSISFAWMVSERINNFPKIRRVNAFVKFIGLLRINSEDVERCKRIKSDFFVLGCSWFIIFLSLAISIEALSHYYRSYCSLSLYQKFTNRYLIPFLFFIAPQFISRLISSIILWLAKDEIQYLWENDKSTFNIFSYGWKQTHKLTDEGLRSGKVHKICRKRTFGSFFLPNIYLLADFYFMIEIGT